MRMCYCVPKKIIVCDPWRVCALASKKIKISNGFSVLSIRGPLPIAIADDGLIIDSSILVFNNLFDSTGNHAPKMNNVPNEKNH